MALLAINKLDLRGDHYQDAPSLIKKLSDNWSDIYKWIWYFFKAVVSMPHKTVDKANSVLAFSRLLICLTASYTLHDLLLKESTSLEMATSLWVESGFIDDDFNVTFHSRGLGTRMFYEVVNRTKPQDFDIIIRVFGGDSKALMQRLIAPLDPLLNPATTTFEAWFLDSIDATFGILSHFHLLPSLFRKSLSPNTVSLATSAVTKVSPLLDSAIPARGSVDAVLRALHFLSRCFCEPDGFQWFTQAANSGLFSAFQAASLQFWRFPFQIISMDGVGKLMNIIPGLLVHRSVVAAVAPSLPDIDLRMRKYLSPDSDERARWTHMHRVATEHLSILKASKKQNALQRLVAACENPEVRILRHHIRITLLIWCSFLSVTPRAWNTVICDVATVATRYYTAPRYMKLSFSFLPSTYTQRPTRSASALAGLTMAIGLRASRHCRGATSSLVSIVAALRLTYNLLTSYVSDLDSDTDVEVQMGKRDAEFLADVAVARAKALRDDFIAVAAAQYPGVPLTKLVIGIHQKQHRPLHTWPTLLEDFVSAHKDIEHQGLQETLRVAMARPEDTTLIVMDIPIGCKKQAILTNTQGCLWKD